jgi:hypothetical protein
MGDGIRNDGDEGRKRKESKGCKNKVKEAQRCRLGGRTIENLAL